MPPDPEATEGGDRDSPLATVTPGDEQAGGDANGDPQDQIATAEQGEEGEEEGEDDEEPKLKYAKLTGSLTSIYRNGDSTSAALVAGDKIVMATHNGSIHVLSLPSLQGLRSWRAHTATITGISVSPIPPPPVTVRSEKGETSILSPGSPTPSVRRGLILRSESTLRAPPNARQSQGQTPAVPNTPNNQIYVATSSLDGHVCVSSLLDQKDVLLRNFARPVNAVALSPDYRNDRTYLSGGLAGQLVLTVGGKAGISEDANTNSSAAAASGWLGTLTGGLAGGGGHGKDTVLHSGEGSIATIRWSLSAKWVVWVNEEGIKIMRSHLRLGSENSEDAWRRIAHAAKPNKKSWNGMAAVWKARCEWVNEMVLEEDVAPAAPNQTNGISDANETGKSTASKKRTRKIEKLVVGWGNTTWLLHVEEGGTSHAGQRQIGSADIIHKLHFRDCIVSGLTMYTPTMVAILAYRTRDDDDKPINTADIPSKGGRQRHRRTGFPPQLRLVNIKDGEEIDVDELSVSRFETLSAQDYHLNTVYMPPPLPEKATKEQSRGAIQAVWEYSGGAYAERLFSSGASIMSGSSSGPDEKNGRPSFKSPKNSVRGVTAPEPQSPRKPVDEHPFMQNQGLKLVIQSPYDCVLAIKRGMADHLDWLLQHERYAEAWQTVDEHPKILEATDRPKSAMSSQPGSPRPRQGTLADFFGDTSDYTGDATSGPQQTPASRAEKRRIGDLWLQQLIAAGNWEEAGRIAGKVLGTSSRWEHWVLTFAQANKFDEITPYIPSTQLQPPLPTLVYEVVFGHYIQADPWRLKELLDTWDPEMFDVGSVISAIEGKLQSGEVTEDTVEGGVRGRDWRTLMEALAKLYLADGRSRDAVKCYIRAQDAEAAMRLIREGNLVETIAEDIPGLLMLRISKEQMRSAPLEKLESASSEATQLLVDEALRGTIPPSVVIQQLEQRGRSFQPLLYFYLRALWRGPPEAEQQTPRRKFDPRVEEGHALVGDFADLAVHLFAEYDRDMLMEFLRASEVYNYEKAAGICEQRHYIPELVYILSKTGQTQKALWLIIGELGDVKQAIAFAKENGELWDDLLDYGMGKPRFIKGLLEEVGTAIDPVKMVRRIPEGLEIEGLKEGIQKLVREYEIQHSISEGVARVLQGEVAAGMDTLRAGRKKAVRFEVVHDQHWPGDLDVAAQDIPTKTTGDADALPVGKRKVETSAAKNVKPGHCVGCEDAFSEEGRSKPPADDVRLMLT